MRRFFEGQGRQAYKAKETRLPKNGFFLRRTRSALRTFDGLSLFRNEKGLTTLAMALALLLCVLLVLSSLRIYGIQSQSAAIQDVADAVALAAQTEVAEFMVLVRLCDALILSFSLLGVFACGVSVVLFCVPGCQLLGEKVFEQGKAIFEAQDKFAERAVSALNRLERALPFLAALKGAEVAQANGGGMAASSKGGAYYGLAVLFPLSGEHITRGDSSHADFGNVVEGQKDALEQNAAKAEEAANKALEAKREAYHHDCGLAPEYCMYERASTLAAMDGELNPYFASVDSWHFSVALDRAQNYYRARLMQESPESMSLEAQKQSALRSIFYRYASGKLSEGYVRESEDHFEAYFPLLPRNTSEMSQTELYRQRDYPLSIAAGDILIHAWKGCPALNGVDGYGSLEELDQGSYQICDSCNFRSSDLGKVAAASSSIENGFEFHYRRVAEAAERYELAQEELRSNAQLVKDQVGGLLDQIGSLTRSLFSKRLQAKPSGWAGAIGIVVRSHADSGFAGLAQNLIASNSELGTLLAVSGATLLEDQGEEGTTIIDELLAGFQPKTVLGDAGQTLLKLWSFLLKGYSSGQAGIVQGLQNLLDGIPLLSTAGLGQWAAKQWVATMEGLGLEPAKLQSLKPVLINTARVAARGGELGDSYLSLKSRALSLSGASSDLSLTLLEKAEQKAMDGVHQLGERIEVARLELPFADIEIPLYITLPQFLTDASSDAVHSLFSRVKDWRQELSGSVTPWR